jgi:hypothetical protein
MAFVTIFLSCTITERTKGIAYLRKYKSDSLEIEIPYTIKGQGNLHSFNLNFKKWQDSSSDWIYISKLQQKITTDRLFLTYTKGCSPQRDLQGEVNIEDSILIVNFKIPRYNNADIIKGWRNYRFNGRYILKNNFTN